ncbi:DUF2798 domain-containing protein [Hydrogenophaga sp. PBL-H3]|uniref:DUF2798 domain-containing protein n=1 Tax=Hydrogenophaga sp. PBL-H3 TaxID=434010 RepID=UPI0013203E9D|nr:DUF2798 domain-containing protein [Hydrogenophaga sp. PBL-H3]QHE77734.1 DUF2798 domain-containing protein [Hydrogenophaga sp. PBL-H3]QHE82158.1 DUF2798 domain-containing protein [Hydrogenophaga sp. PBL-H3]
MKLPHKFAGFAFAAYMAGIIAFVMSAVLTAINTGLGNGFVLRVFQAYAVAFPVAFTCVVIFRPVVVFLMGKTVHGPGLAPTPGKTAPPSR